MVCYPSLATIATKAQSIENKLHKLSKKGFSKFHVQESNCPKDSTGGAFPTLNKPFWTLQPNNSDDLGTRLPQSILRLVSGLHDNVHKPIINLNLVIIRHKQ